MPAGYAAPAPTAELDALFLPFATGALRLPVDGQVWFFGARAGVRLREMAQPGWCCTQDFKPFADALTREGYAVGAPAPAPEARFAVVALLPARSREVRRIQFAQAVQRVSPGGVVLACVANAEGAKSAQADLALLLGPVQSLSKHKCRVFWATADTIDTSLLAAWGELDTPRMTAAGYLSRPGLFAWDRVDPASALLASQLPADLHGRVADLGAGYGYLASQVVARCPQVRSLDLYEADARALTPARENLVHAVASSGREVDVEVHWHDVTRGLPERYDAIVSNPPFHFAGRAELPALGQAFIASAADALTADGRLLLVANRQLPYEGVLAARFTQVRQLALRDGFKAIEASGVRS